MTYEEAKMQIQAIPGKIWDQLSEPDREAMEMAFSALERQIPKKLIADGDGYADGLREPTKEEREQDIEFLTHILFAIRDYARSAGQEPDETLRAIAEWILALLKVATFNGAEGE